MTHSNNRDREDVPLSPREREVLALIAAGHSTPAIAEQLGITAGTVKAHLTSIYKKTRVHNRVQAARYYLDHSARSRRGQRREKS
jgi:DNA-binding CsgD family transcriptional regulator